MSIIVHYSDMKDNTAKIYQILLLQVILITILLVTVKGMSCPYVMRIADTTAVFSRTTSHFLRFNMGLFASTRMVGPDIYRVSKKITHRDIRRR